MNSRKCSFTRQGGEGGGYSLGVVVQVLGDVVHQLALRGLVSHGFVQLAGHQGLGHGLLPPLPQEERHLLALHQHRPHHQLVERVLEPADLGVVHVHVDLLLLLLLHLLLALRAWLVILVKDWQLFIAEGPIERVTEADTVENASPSQKY
ncbi:hypothetical protein ANANG_G00205640 [Anguilla anguilla]|uniref:Uncharacterized protein n=1 Tax=Anguilla anguilla TaxID=7936 RepID=A0A9D3M2C9_ANGAN|nr:hypothetical protein ANANG_G00205640 [Anguilla anguilla]